MDLAAGEVDDDRRRERVGETATAAGIERERAVTGERGRERGGSLSNCCRYVGLKV